MKAVLMNLEIIAINIMLTMFVLSGIEKIVSFDANVNQLKAAVEKWGISYHSKLIKGLIVLSLLIEILAPMIVNYGITTKKYSYIKNALFLYITL